MTNPTRADWYTDPFERFELRYFNGTRWTSHVASAGIQITDPEPPPSTAGSSPKPPARSASARASRLSAAPPDERPTEAPPSSAPPAPHAAPPTEAAPSARPAKVPGLSLSDEKRVQMGWLTVACGVAVVIGAFLPWGTSRAGSRTGIDLSLGWLSVVGGVVIAVYGRQALVADTVIRQHGRALFAIINTALIGFIAATVADVLDEASFGAANVEVGTGAWLTLGGSLLAIWPYVLFRRDYSERKRVSRAAVARSATAAASTPMPLPPGIPPAPR